MLFHSTQDTILVALVWLYGLTVDVKFGEALDACGLDRIGFFIRVHLGDIETHL